MLQEIVYQGIRMVRTLSRLAPQWLLGVPRVVRFLMGMWTSTEWRNRVHDDSPHTARNAHEFSLLLKILIQYCRTTLITNGSSTTVATTFLTSPSAGQYIQPLFDLLLAFSRPVGSSGMYINWHVQCSVQLVVAVTTLCYLAHRSPPVQWKLGGVYVSHILR